MTRALVLALLVLAVTATTGLAVPGDPPIATLSPADGAKVTVDLDGVAVSFACPPYYENDFRRESGILSEEGSGYGVRVSPTTDVGPGGLLADQLSADNLPEQRRGTSTCDARLGDFSAGVPASSRWQLRPGGPYYWQAYRACTTCAGEVEVGPVRSFTVAPDAGSVTLAVKTPRRAYAGVARLVEVEVRGATEEPEVVLERRTKRGWRRIPSRNALNLTADRVARFPRGSYAFRARTTLPQSGRVVSRRRKVVVRRAGRGVRGTDGRYRGVKRDLELRVTKGGRLLRGFTATFTGTCPTTFPDGTINLNPLPVSAVFGPVRVAPDGRFVGLVDDRALRAHLSGRLTAKGIVGTVNANTGQCSGRIKRFTARR